MPSLREKNGAYFIDYRLNGKRVRKNVGRSKRIATLALKDIEVKLAKGELGFESKDSDLNKLFSEFKDYSEARHAPSSKKPYRAILDNFRRFFLTHPNISKISLIFPRKVGTAKS